MTGYERIVHDISIGREDGAANRRTLKSLSGIACRLSESADTPNRCPAAARCGAPRSGALERMKTGSVLDSGFRQV
ncbi:hypothetical protein [Burkholderia latens]|uniref:Uncharacterized protein n=1 Tax=Burkholderia latens TaxID=488446 RepID=A0A6H9T9X1_9BURK|nr:hypothetical protein [Burkholderia latens]KAB0637885.1 hypothetical protein F7R21_20625 [Burkholderia latens]